MVECICQAVAGVTIEEIIGKFQVASSYFGVQDFLTSHDLK